MHKPLLSLAFGAFLLLSASAARADVPPFCNQFDAAVTCAEADVGYACPSGGTCVQVDCYVTTTSPSHVFKCETCPVKVEDPAMVCTGGQDWGKSCGVDGTCDRVPSYCPAAGGYSSCVKTGDPHQGQGGQAGSGGAGAAGTAGQGTAGAGGEAGASAAGSSAAGADSSAGSSAAGAANGAGTSAAGAASTPSDDSDSGCSMSTSGRHNALAALLALAGAAALLIDRRRR